MLRPQFIVLGFVLLVGVICTGLNVHRATHPAKSRNAIAREPIELMSGGQDLDRSPLVDQPVQMKVEEIPPVDVALLKQLPPVCTAEIPGLSPTSTFPDHSNFVPPVGFDPSPTLQTTIAQNWESGESSDEVLKTISHAQEPTAPEHSPVGELPVVTDSAPMVTPADHPVEKNGLSPSVASNATPADPHAELYARCEFPSAAECAQCHQQIYDEWSASSHAYASISPMFNRFEDTIQKLTSGTIGYFCMRCHAPVATIMEHPRDQAIYDGPRVFREGVTCVACHRVREAYTKSNGERRIESGDPFQPVYGGSDGLGNELAIKYKDFFKTKTSHADTSSAQAIHSRSIQFEQISQSDFCMSCHQVAVPPGIKLEVVWDQYRASPAYRAGVTCQDCHMGKVPGVDGGYSVGPAAVVANHAVIAERKHSNHSFYGPGNTIAHPGIFPQDPRADRWTPDQWLEFDWRAGWGTEDFERQVAEAQIPIAFPTTWSNADDRYDARELVESNLKKLQYKNDLRRQVLENGSKIAGPVFARPPRVQAPLVFEYCVSNLNPGHNLPSGSLGAQPQLWLNVALIGPDGQRLWESGYLDSYGDLADIQSADVHCGKIPFDDQLFNLQTKFLTTNVKGTDREMFLPINFDIDQLPFIRPAPQPVTVLNHPPGIRMEAHSLPPLGSRFATYKIPACLIQAPGTYRLSMRMRSRMEPIYFMKFCDATPDMIRSMNESILDVHAYSVAFEIQ